MDRISPAFGKTLSVARAPIAAFAAMGVLWGTFAAVLPDLKAQLGVDERTLGLLLLATPLAAVLAMLAAPRAALVRALAQHWMTSRCATRRSGAHIDAAAQ